MNIEAKVKRILPAETLTFQDGRQDAARGIQPKNQRIRHQGVRAVTACAGSTTINATAATSPPRLSNTHHNLNNRRLNRNQKAKMRYHSKR